MTHSVLHLLGYDHLDEGPQKQQMRAREEAILADRIIAMEKGKIVLEGTPKEVFTQVDRIRGLGLECPLAAEVADALDKQGHQLPPIITHKELCEALCPSK